MTSERIGRADYELGTDQTKLKQGLKEADAAVQASGKASEAAYTKSGAAAGAGFSSGLKQAFVRGVAGAGAIAFGFATKGVLELQEATASFRAETGATADEADRASKAINGMSGKNLQGVKEIGGALEKVHTDLGLTGTEAERLTQRFLRFGRATKQEAGASVVAFDDILDAWGKTAQDADGIMDQLIASHQRYGGAIEANERTLAALAPTLRAANLTLDDGIGLLNLFAASGIDAAAAPQALQRALSKIKSPEDLKRLLADIVATEDPLLRASKAADLFGDRAGAKLANVLKPGIGSLQDYTISAQDAAGATDKAADAMDSSFGAQAQLRVKAFMSALTGIGASMGPVLTGMAGLVSLGGSMGLDRVVSRALGQVASSGLVKGAASRAGLVVGTVLSGAMFAGDKLGDALGGALGKLPGSAGVKGAMGRVGKALGGGLGTGLAVGFAAVAVVEVVATYNRIKGELAAQGEQIGKAVADQLTTGTVDQLKTSRAAVAQGLSDLNGVWDAGLFTTDTRTKLQAQLDALDATIASRAAAIPTAVGDALKDGEPTVSKAGGWLFHGIPAQMDLMRAELERIAAHMPGAIADRMRSRRGEIDAVWEQLREDIRKNKGPEDAKVLGYLISRSLAKALHSADPLIRNSGKAAKDAFLERFAEVVPASGEMSKKAMKELNDALHSKNADVRAEARKIKELLEKGIKPTKAKDAGTATGDDVITGLNGRSGAVGSAAYALGRRIALEIVDGVKSVTRVPSSVKSGGGGGGGGGSSHPRALAAGSWKVLDDNMLAMLHRDEMVAPAQSASLMRALGQAPLSAVDVGRMAAAAPSGASGSSGPSTVTVGDINMHVALTGNVRYTDQEIDHLGQRLGDRMRLSLVASGLRP